jgi:hypothetical protein
LYDGFVLRYYDFFLIENSEDVVYI